MSVPLVVTDLDGTLLDHDSYSFAPAAQALATIRARNIPLVLCSSKTRAEMLPLQAELGISGPFICENGAGICTVTAAGAELEALAAPRSEVLALLHTLREQEGFRFTGFADMSVEELAETTGLSLAAAALAAQREFSEPLRWEDSEQELPRFRSLLQQHGLTAQQGGRFLSVAGPTDKGAALNRLRLRYVNHGPVIALGDSPNDLSMLAAADIGVIIKSARSDSLQPEGPGRILRTQQRGPSGWQEAMSGLLDEFSDSAER